MATAADACANIQTETEREKTTTKLKLKETGAEKTAANIREVEADDVEKEYVGISTREQVVAHELEEAEVVEQQEEEDIEVLYDSLELPQIPAVKTSAVAALEQKLTKAAAFEAAVNSETANQLKVEVRVENVDDVVDDDDDDDDEDGEVAKAAATKIDTTIANGEKEEEEENKEEFKREQTKQQDVVDYCKMQEQQQQQQQQQKQQKILQKLQKQREEYLMIDDIPEPIKVLDDIISEFEASSEVKPAIGSVENQSEDDGYMSLSRKK